jgi:hypothetical protein
MIWVDRFPTHEGAHRLLRAECIDRGEHHKAAQLEHLITSLHQSARRVHVFDNVTVDEHLRPSMVPRHFAIQIGFHDIVDPVPLPQKLDRAFVDVVTDE